MTQSGDGARAKGGHVVTTDIDGAGIDQVLRNAVDSGAVPHVAAIAADRDGVIYAGAAGPRAVGEDAPVSTDTVFRLMSMTKTPATVVALQEMEKGNLELDAPVVNYCPEFDEVQVLTGFDGDTRGSGRRPARPRSGSSSRTPPAWATGSSAATWCSGKSSPASPTWWPG